MRRVPRGLWWFLVVVALIIVEQWAASYFASGKLYPVARAEQFHYGADEPRFRQAEFFRTTNGKYVAKVVIDVGPDDLQVVRDLSDGGQYIIQSSRPPTRQLVPKIALFRLPNAPSDPGQASVGVDEAWIIEYVFPFKTGTVRLKAFWPLTYNTNEIHGAFR